MVNKIEAKELCSRCEQEVSYPRNKINYSTYLEDELLKQFAPNPSNILKKDDYIEYIFCYNCRKELESLKKRKELQERRTELRQTRCDYCQQFLLGEKSLFVLYYLVLKERKDFEEGENLLDRILCEKCWKENKYLFIDSHWEEIFLNEDSFLKLDRDKKRISYYSLKN